MASATVGLAAGLLLAGPISQVLFATESRTGLVRAAFIGLWAQMNYEQLTSLFRVEERSIHFVLATLTNLLITVAATIVLVVGLDQGALGVVVGNFTGTLSVYLVLLLYRRYQLGLEFDRSLLREMNRFGVPLVPSALALWATNFSDRFFLVKLADVREVGVYSIGVRIASALVLLLTAFRTAWPAFAYSIDDDREARRTYGFVLTYLIVLASWLALTLGLLSPWLVRLLTTPEFYSASRVVAPLSFAGVAFAGYIVMAIGVGRARRTQFNWVVTGAGALVNVALNLILIPPYGMMGAAVAMVAAFTTMFVGMTWNAQSVYRVPYQWRRVFTAAGAAVALTVLGKLVDAPLGLAIALAAVYPLVLLPLGFYLPGERRRFHRLIVRRAT
jgi:O-antigen/teichoic acid export membrane protein